MRFLIQSILVFGAAMADPDSDGTLTVLSNVFDDDHEAVPHDEASDPFFLSLDEKVATQSSDMRKYRKYTLRHKEIIERLAKQRPASHFETCGFYERACAIFRQEGLSPMGPNTFRNYINRARSKLERAHVAPSKSINRAKPQKYSEMHQSILEDAVRESPPEEQVSELFDRINRIYESKGMLLMRKSTFYQKLHSLKTPLSL